MYKIYINDTLLILSQTDYLEQINNLNEKDLIARYAGLPKYLLHYIDLAEKGSINKSIIIHSKDYPALKKDFKSLFKIEKAAGGLVKNEKNEGLLIFRKGFWDLPKGKIEKGEKKKQAAIREVMEETGLEELQLIQKLGKTYHTYRSISSKRVLKRTHWYLMKANQKELRPQLNEGIIKAQWDDLEDFIQNPRTTYHNITDLIKFYLENPFK